MKRNLKLGMTATGLLSLLALAAVPFIPVGTQESRTAPGGAQFACQANWQNGACGTANEVNGTNHGGNGGNPVNNKTT